MQDLVYDTGALIALEADDRAAWLIHRRALWAGGQILVPAPVLAQAWRGGPQALLSRALVGCLVRVMDERQAREVGRLLAGAGGSDVVDAAVVVLAGATGSDVVTSDVGDLSALVEAGGLRIRLLAV